MPAGGRRDRPPAAAAEQQCVTVGPNRDDATRRRRDGGPIAEHVTDRRLAPHRSYRGTAAPGVGPPAPPPQSPLPATLRPGGLAIAGADRLVIVVGPAGTGKTHTTASAVQRLHADGRHVVGLAPSGKGRRRARPKPTARPTPSPGSFTSHRTGRTPWPTGTTVILDEAGMAATTDLASTRRPRPAVQWRLVVVGDPEQLLAVGRGGVFAHWSDTLPHLTLDTPRRFCRPMGGRCQPRPPGRVLDAVAEYEPRATPPTRPPWPPGRRATATTPTPGPWPPPTPRPRSINRDPTPTPAPDTQRRRHQRACRRSDHHLAARLPDDRPARRSKNATPGLSWPSDPAAESQSPTRDQRRTPRRLRPSVERRTGMGRHRLRQPGRHRRHRYRRPRRHHEPQPRLCRR